MDHSVTEEILRAAAETAKTVQALELGVEGLKAAASSQEKRLGEIRENIGRGVEALGRFAQNADDVADSIDSVAASAQRGMGNVETLASDVRVMSGQVASSDGFLKDLAETINEIVKTVAAIKETSEDLAVISINTAIEAARAGDKGRGFAVIAREVRKLADRSGELSDLIGKSVTEAGTKLGGVRKAVGSAEASSRSAAEASQSFTNDFSTIVESALRAKELVAGFRAVARERLDGERNTEVQVLGISAEARAVIDKGNEVSSLAAALRSSTERTLSSIAGERSGRHEKALAEAEKLARSLVYIDLQSRESVDAALSAAFSRSDAFELLYVMDASGKQVSSNVINPSCVGKISTNGFGVDRSAKEYFREPARNRASYHSPAYLSSASGLLCITASVPLTDSTGMLRGVLAADVDAGGLSSTSCAN
ncbi:MAG: methyl-accepting chemotaxis protein [Treponemataceae bacterium]